MTTLEQRVRIMIGASGPQLSSGAYEVRIDEELDNLRPASLLELISDALEPAARPEAAVVEAKPIITGIFFVLNGLMNGEEGVKAVPAGGGGEGERLRPLADGWYYHQGDSPDGQGPYRTREEAVRRAEADAGLLKLDAGAIQKALLAGHLSPMDATTRMGYADAPAFCLCGEVGDFFVTVGWDPEDGDWRCEAYLGDAAAQVDLKDGSWQRL